MSLIRVIAATKEDLRQSADQGRFRADLYYRLNVAPLRIPPLRERLDDVPPLSEHFVAKLAATEGKAVRGLSQEALDLLMGFDWPGNVRELRNLIERSVILGSLPEAFAGHGTVDGLRAIEDLELVTQRHMLHILDLSGGNRAEAARRLGVSRKTVDRKLAAWAAEGLDIDAL